MELAADTFVERKESEVAEVSVGQSKTERRTVAKMPGSMATTGSTSRQLNAES